MNRPAILLALGALLSCGHAASIPSHAAVTPFLEKYCFDCHDADTKKGDLQLDTLALNFADPAKFAQWEHVFDKVARGEMPPKKKPRPAATEAKPAMDWLRASLHQASAARQAIFLAVQRRREAGA